MFYQSYVCTLSLNNGLLKYSVLCTAQERMINTEVDDMNTKQKLHSFLELFCTEHSFNTEGKAIGERRE